MIRSTNSKIKGGVQNNSNMSFVSPAMRSNAFWEKNKLLIPSIVNYCDLSHLVLGKFYGTRGCDTTRLSTWWNAITRTMQYCNKTINCRILVNYFEGPKICTSDNSGSSRKKPVPSQPYFFNQVSRNFNNKLMIVVTARSKMILLKYRDKENCLLT